MNIKNSLPIKKFISKFGLDKGFLDKIKTPASIPML